MTNKKILYSCLALGLFVVVVFSLGLGAMKIPVLDVLTILANKIGIIDFTVKDDLAENVLIHVRLPRILLGVLVGAALGISGAAVQGIFRNPLAEPGLIGISAALPYLRY